MKKLLTIFALLPLMAHAGSIVADDQGNLYSIYDDNQQDTQYVVGDDGQAYAIDANVNAVPKETVLVDDAGNPIALAPQVVPQNQPEYIVVNPQ